MIEDCINDKDTGFVQMIDNIIRDNRPGLPDFIFDSKMYQEFILPLSVAIVSSVEANTIDQIKQYCVNINSVEFASVAKNVYYEDYAYIKHRFFIINELYHESSILWKLEIPAISNENAYINILIQVYKHIPIADNILKNMKPRELMQYLTNDIYRRMSKIIGGEQDKYMIDIFHVIIEYIHNNFDSDMINDIVIDIRKNMTYYTEADHKSATNIDGLAIVMRELNILNNHIFPSNDDADIKL